eukprot:m.247315 g.247315  ORF g.247315 m.247315 type:complete len:259 (+) comp15348_c0_seq1:10-786(+)
MMSTLARVPLRANGFLRRACFRMSSNFPPGDAPDTAPVSKRMKENILTIPNLLTTSRIFLTPVIGYNILYEHHSTALGLFVFAAATDVLDGVIARNFKGQQSLLGAALDPFADKVFVAGVTVPMAMSGLLPASLAGLIVARDAGLMVSSFYIRYISLKPFIQPGERLTLKRYFQLDFPTVQVKPLLISKVNTILQCGSFFLPLVRAAYPALIDPTLLQGVWIATAVTTLWSGLAYMRGDAVTYLRDTKDIKDIKDQEQ